MDMRSISSDSRSNRSWSCFGLRRRNLSSKLISVLVQILIVIVVWVVVKRSCSVSYNNGEDGITVRKIKSAEDQGDSLCNNGDFVKGTSLRIEDIMSISDSTGPNGKQRQIFLEVDVLTRDVEQGSPILYPVGTPVIVDGFFDDEMEQIEEADKTEFNYDNSIETRDLDNNENDGSEYPEDKNEEETLSEEMEEEEGKDENDEYSEEKESVIVLKNNNVDPAMNGGVGQLIQEFDRNDNVQNNQENSVQMNPPAMQMGQSVGAQISQNQMAGMGVQNQRAQILPGQQQLQQNAVFANSAVQNKNDQSQSGLQYLPQRNQVGNQLQQNGQNLNQFRPGIDLFPQGNAVNSPARQQFPGLHSSSNSLAANNAVNINGVNNVHQDSPGENQALVNMNHGQESLSEENDIYSKGFKERLTLFKMEFYGRAVDDSSDQIPTSYSMNNPNLCDSFDVIDVLFVINTIPQSNEQRRRIRNTFVNASLFQPFKIAHVFFVGQTSSPNFQANLDKESEQYKDIVQGEFVDTPETKATKGLVSFRWVITYCPKTRFVMKLDEDIFVDSDKLLKGLIPATADVIEEKTILCFLVQNAPIPRSGPNAFDPNKFPKSSRMRPYCKGFAVLMTGSAVSSLLAASEHVPLFQFDDLYLYGILPFVAGGISVYDLSNNRAFHDFGMTVVDCYKELQDNCQYVATKAFSSRFTSLWEYVAARKKPGAPQFQANPSLWKITEYQSSFYT